MRWPVPGTHQSPIYGQRCQSPAWDNYSQGRGLAMQTLVEGLSACEDYVQLLQQLDKAAERAVDTELAHLSELNEPYLARELSRGHATGPLWGMWGAAEFAPYGIVCLWHTGRVIVEVYTIICCVNLGGPALGRIDASFTMKLHDHGSLPCNACIGLLGYAEMFPGL